ncbi:MAG TPA: pyridoxamine 5'-phosphate oxidase family protein [Acidiferrobacteraceae bacterium]|nr:pyridoxamine 5'-phosphate oxidase family protein [Acidiferrobacteraceae bacterium]
MHAGELEAQRRFGAEHAWPDFLLDNMIAQVFRPGVARFLEAQPFFFIATANDRGDCDCSFRAVEGGAGAATGPSVKVLTENMLVFPDYSGNNLYNSLGNILTNPHIGMLFIDFGRALRLRVNGRASIIEEQQALSQIWPTALRYVKVDVDQVYGNCQQRIPRMTFVNP